MPATNDVLQLTAEEEQEACARNLQLVRRRPSHGPQGGHRARPLTDHRQGWPSHSTELRGDCRRPAAEREPLRLQPPGSIGFSAYSPPTRSSAASSRPAPTIAARGSTAWHPSASISRRMRMVL
ncbi:unnamed protein product [Musa acuminata subsp. burmannicoides]